MPSQPQAQAQAQAQAQLPLTFTHAFTFPADPSSTLQGQLIAALVQTVIFHRALGNVRPKSIPFLENSFPAIADERVDDLVEEGVQASRVEIKRRGAVQLVIGIFPPSSRTSASAPQTADSKASPSSGSTSPSSTTAAPSSRERLKSLPSSWFSQAVNLANQAYTHGYAFSGYGLSAGDVVHGHGHDHGHGGEVGGRMDSGKSTGGVAVAGDEIPFEEWVFSIRTVSVKTEHERSKALQSTSKQLAKLLEATVDFVDRCKAHLPPIPIQNADLFPFPIRVKAMPCPPA
ncbi:unnamed protein product [Tilletia laevis]|uniref:Autophagy-related protein 101 n=2 Tax=Tilletia TaxID=13289 RepID=A0A177V8X3_9BASI|nr:hypothetical protein CF336_g1172 [Tilletia laevis]KAE8263880.1 hypothetical protein A4X03_0g1354 [Tilletia caries]KAE8207426.1 hypothetical protein CF335_g1151 [Tilletia laevis]CAD6887507.1 unnamed protein product [Tilletia caries]CAD6901738.1 unnamed protein product [Tilletia laevis]